MQNFHQKLKRSFEWYGQWHNHPRHQHAHWFGLFAFLLLTTSFISAEVVFLYSERFEAQAQTALPAPNHPIAFGYYYSAGQYGNFISETGNYTNTDLIIAGSWIRGAPDCMRDTAGLDSAFRSAVAAGNRIVYFPIEPGATQCPDGQSEYTVSLNVARNYWNSIDYLYPYDEPNWDRATTESRITTLENALRNSGVASKPIMVNYTPNGILNGTSYLASNIDVVGIEAYMPIDQQNSPSLVADLNAQIDQMKARIGNRQMMIVVQGYGRNYCPTGSSTLCWSNLESLKSMQAPAYLKTYNDPRVVGLFIFSYARLSGTKDLVENRNGQCIKTEHERIWGAINGSAQPATISCGGSGGGGTPPADINLLRLSDGTFPDVMFYQGRVWVVYETAGRSLLRIESFNPDLSDRRVEKEISTGSGAGPFPRIAAFNNTVWVSYRRGTPGESQMLWRMDTDTTEDLGPAAGNNSSALGFGKIAYQDITANGFGVRMRDLTGGTPNYIRPGAPTGIARVTSPNTVVLIDEDRLAVPWGIEPWFAGALTVASAFQDNQGAVARFNDDPATQFNLWVGIPSSFNPHAATDGNGNYAVVTWGITTSGVRIATFRGPGASYVTPDPVNATQGWRGSLAFNSVDDNWAVISERTSQSTIYARIMGDDAQPITPEFVVSTNSVPALAPKIAYDSTRNRYLAIWVGFPVANQSGEWYGQFIKADGTLDGQNFLIPRDRSGWAILSYPNALLRYDRINDEYSFVWENRPSGEIQTNFRTISGDGTPGTTIVTDETPGILHGAPAMDINPGNEACVAYQWHTNDSTYVNIAIQRIDLNTGQVSAPVFLPSRAAGESNISYNSTDDTYLVTWMNSARTGVRGIILNSCNGADISGQDFSIGNFGAGLSAHNPNTNTFAVVGQDWTTVANHFVILDNSGNVLDQRLIFTDATNGNFAPVVGANSNRGTYGATSSRDRVMTRFISPLGLGIGGGGATPIPSPEPCGQGVVQPGIPVICDFTPSIARPGDTINVTGGNLSTTVQLISSSGATYTVTGTADATGASITFNIPTDIVPENTYTLIIMGAGNNTRATSNQLLFVTLNIPSEAGAQGEDTPFSQSTDVVVPQSNNTFQSLISSSLTYAVYAVGIAVFIMILYAGFLWITSAANPGNIALAKRYMTNAIIGAVLLLSSYIILYTINPDLVGGSFTLDGLNRIIGTSGVSIITQPTCDNGVCSNNTGNTCTQNTDCNAVCVNNACNNGVIGACTLDTDCQIIPRYIASTETETASAFAAGCARINGVGFQDFSAVECPGSMSLALDPILQIQDSGANQQVGATAIQTSGNNGAGRKIVILDTGYNYNHPELSSSYGGGKDFINNDNDPMDDQSSGTGNPGHGSHVAGIITADGINSRAKGVAPQSQIIAGKVLDARGQGQYSTIITAIYWAVNGPDNIYGTSDDFRPDAINLSVGGGSYTNFCDNDNATTRDMDKAIRYAKDRGVLVVVAAGNTPSGVMMPGCVSSAFTVGAVDSSDQITSYSGRGAGVDIVAPGGFGGTQIYSSLLGSNYGDKSGTSMASPMVAGLVALIKSAFPNYSVAQVEKAITDTAVDLGAPGKDTLYGWGRISATAAGTGSSACSGECGTLVASPASCTKGSVASNPNCNITLNYTSSGVSPSNLVIRKDSVNLQTLTSANGAITDTNPPAGAYVYSLQNSSTGAIISSTTVYVYYAGTLTSSWLSCNKNQNPANLNCDIALNYNLSGNISGTAIIYKNGVAWRSISLPSGTTIDTNPSSGIHTYTIRDSRGLTQVARLVVRIEDTARSRVISSLSSSTVSVGNQITITGTNLGSPLEVSRGYFTVQIHDNQRIRHTTIGTLNPSNTSGTWTVSLGSGMQPGDYTLRVGPTLNMNDVSNEVRLTIISPTAPQSVPVTLCSGINYTGTCETFSANDPDLSNNTIGNNNTRSVNLGTQSDIRLCDNANYGGYCESFFGNDPDLSNNTISNNASSLGSY